MAQGDTQREVADAAEQDGVHLGPQSVDWLCQRGHLALPEDSPAFAALERIYLELGGNLELLATARSTRLTGDFHHSPTGTLVEVDESQHFTSARLLSLELYPADVPLGFDLDAYKPCCSEWRGRSDGYFRTKAARGFGPGGRQRQRAYYDALRDLAAPAMGRPGTIRVQAADRDGAAAYARSRGRLVGLLAQ